MTGRVSRAAMPAHARDIAALLAGLGAPRRRRDVLRAMQAPRTLWHVVENGEGAVLGVQWIEPRPIEAAEIFTFIAENEDRLSIGSALFAATRAAAAGSGYRRLIAEVSPENAGALVYYRSRGFEETAGARRPGHVALVHDLR